MSRRDRRRLEDILVALDAIAAHLQRGDLSAVPAVHEIEWITAPAAFRRHGIFLAAAALESA